LLGGINWKDLPEVMVLLIDVPPLRTHLGCLGQVNESSNVLKELAVDHRIGLGDVYPLLLHLLEEVHHDNCNTEALAKANILTLSSGEDHLSLQLGSPDNRASSIADDIACLGLGCGWIIHGILLIPVTCKVSINVNLKGLGDIRA
jgi:hypothetical protein